MCHSEPRRGEESHVLRGKARFFARYRSLTPCPPHCGGGALGGMTHHRTFKTRSRAISVLAYGTVTPHCTQWVQVCPSAVAFPAATRRGGGAPGESGIQIDVSHLMLIGFWIPATSCPARAHTRLPLEAGGPLACAGDALGESMRE